jgi:hypothetical protein
MGVSSAFAMLSAHIVSDARNLFFFAQTRMFQPDARLVRGFPACLNGGQDFRWNVGIFRRNTDLLCERVVGTVAAKTPP